MAGFKTKWLHKHKGIMIALKKLYEVVWLPEVSQQLRKRRLTQHIQYMFYIYSAALVTFYIYMSFTVWKRMQVRKGRNENSCKGQQLTALFAKLASEH